MIGFKLGTINYHSYYYYCQYDMCPHMHDTAHAALEGSSIKDTVHAA